MAEIRLRLKKTVEFGGWYDSLSDTLRARVDARIELMKEGHFGSSRNLGGGIFELKWKNGLRVYFSRRRIANVNTIILWGGFKGSQEADIRKARRLKERYEDELERKAAEGDPASGS